MLDGHVAYYIALKGTVSLLAAAFAVTLLMGGPRRAPNLFLAAFLGLLSMNQGIEALRLALQGLIDDVLLVKLALVAAAADPFFLYYFASVFPERNRLNRPAAVLAVAAACAVFLVFVPAFQGFAADAFSRWLSAAWEAVTFTVYGVVFVRFLTLVRREDRHPEDGRPAPRLFYYAMAVAFLPVGPRMVRQVFIAADAWRVVPEVVVPVVVLPLLTVLAVVLLATRRATGPTRRRLLLGAALGVGFGLLLLTDTMLISFGAIGPAQWVPAMEQTMHAARWFLFATLASVAVVRHDMLGIPIAARRSAARLMVALGVVVLAGVFFLMAYVRLGGAAFALRPVDLVFLVLIIALSRGYRSAIDRVATRLYGVPPHGDMSAKIGMYRSAVAQADAGGRDLVAERGLARLRAELDLDPQVADVIERMATDRAAVRLTPGGTVQGRYAVGRLLGRGASGRVFAARDQLLDREVVLKEAVASGPAEARAALAEGRLAGRVDHPNVLRVHDALATDGAVLLVTERLDGGTLAERIAQAGPLDVETAARLFDGVLAGLEAIHQEGIVHRDLKPVNILLSGDGTPKIGDFGIATRPTRIQDAGPPRLWGTPEYMAPEQLRGGQATPQSDLFAVGAMMVRCTRGAAPEWRPVIERAQATEPAARWGSAAEMRHALRQAQRARLEATAGVVDPRPADDPPSRPA